MKDESNKSRMNKHKTAWIIDESKYLSKSEYETLQRTCLKEISDSGNTKFNKIRNWFMVELGLKTGLRVSEMTSLKHNNLLLDNGKSSIKVLGKGSKLRSVIISSKLRSICIRYIGLKKDYGFSTDNEAYLLNNPKDNRISKRALQKAFKILVRKAGLPSHYHIHCLRHTYTTFLLKASNNNYRFAQLQLGHASIRTTQTYAGVLESEGRKALERLYR